jgi:hypothetical protein
VTLAKSPRYGDGIIDLNRKWCATASSKVMKTSRAKARRASRSAATIDSRMSTRASRLFASSRSRSTALMRFSDSASFPSRFFPSAANASRC